MVDFSKQQIDSVAKKLNLFCLLRDWQVRQCLSYSNKNCLEIYLEPLPLYKVDSIRVIFAINIRIAYI